MASKSLRWEILHEDEACIIINKPASLLSIPDRYDPEIPNLHSSLLQYREEIFVNHRLDKNTSGVILYSKTAEAHKAFSQMFEQGEMDKYYYALVHGTPAENIGLIDLPLAASKSGKKGMVVNPKGKQAQTKYRILKSWDLYSWLEIKLLTGRMHQIRVHMQSISCPIIADSLYGDGEAFFLSQIKRKYRRSHSREEKALLNRQALHAYKLEFVHPLNGNNITVEAEMPKDMKAVIYQLDKNLSDY